MCVSASISILCHPYSECILYLKGARFYILKAVNFHGVAQLWKVFRGVYSVMKIVVKKETSLYFE